MPGAQGAVAPGFEPVVEVFERMLRRRGELGAAVAAVVDGVTVVDLWGGPAAHDRRRPWTRETVVMCFSATKGKAVAVALARGYLDLEAPVSRYWPEFAQGGKGAVTVRQLLAHQAGLSTVDLALDAAVIADRATLTAALARGTPAWEPGTRHGYHSVTLAFYESELLRRVDPAGRPLGAGRRDLVLHVDSSYSVGFLDPDRGLGYGFVVNRMGFHGWDDPRELAVRRALLRCLDG